MRLPCHGLLQLLHRSWVNSSFFRGRYAQRAQQPFSTACSHNTAHAAVPVGLNGNIALDIHYPPNPTHSTPILIYVPGGLVPTFPTSALPTSSLIANITIVCLRYRASPENMYPVPIHDVLAGYDWIIKRLVRGSAAHNSWQSVPTNFARIAVCGELLGGSLAAMLALTECHTYKAGGIKAAALRNPVTDWTSMYPVATPTSNTNTLMPEDGDTVELRSSVRKRRLKAKGKASNSWTAFSDNPVLTSEAILLARDALFAKPEHYHDPFASPLLFFSTASSDIPSNPPGSLDATISSPQPSPAQLGEFIRKRCAQRRHPSLGSDLVLPRTKVVVGKESVLRDQGLDLVDAMRRSVNIYERKGRCRELGMDFDDGLGDTTVNEGKVQAEEMEGVAMWTEEDFVEVASWAGDAVRD